MKFCTKCGKQIHDEAVICIHCGNTIGNIGSNIANSDDEKLKALSVKINTNAIIWMVIGVIQILSVVCAIVGILNIMSALKDMKYSKDILNNPTGIVETFEPTTGPIIVLAYNLIFGGVIGVIGSIYYFLGIRGFVMENADYFNSLG